MRGIWMAVLLLLALPLAARDRVSREDIEFVLIRRVDVRITVDPQGRLIKQDIHTPVEGKGAVGEDIRKALSERIAQLRFEPVLVGGKPVTAETTMRLTLAAKKTEDGSYVINMDNITFPMKATKEPAATQPDAQHGVRISAKSMKPPQYPMEMLGFDCVVLLNLRLTQDGRVAEVAVPQSSLINVKGRQREFAKALSRFEQSAVKAAMQWQFEVESDGVPPSAAAMTVAVPVRYFTDNMDMLDKVGVWEWTTRSVWKRPGWLEAEDSQRVGVADLADGEMASLDTAFKLVGSLNNTAL